MQRWIACLVFLFCLNASALSDRLVFSVQGEMFFHGDIQAIQKGLEKDQDFRMLKEVFSYRQVSLQSLSAEQDPYSQISFLVKLLSYLLSQQNEQKVRFKTNEELWENKLKKVEQKLRSRFDLKLKVGKEIKKEQQKKRRDIMLSFIKMIEEKVILDAH